MLNADDSGKGSDVAGVGNGQPKTKFNGRLD